MCWAGWGDAEGSAERSPTAAQLTVRSAVKGRGREAQQARAPARHLPRTGPAFLWVRRLSEASSSERALRHHSEVAGADPAAGAPRAQPGLDGTGASSICRLTVGAAPAPITLPLPSARRCAPVTCAKPGRQLPSVGPRLLCSQRSRPACQACCRRLSVCLPHPTADLARRRPGRYLLQHLCCLLTRQHVRVVVRPSLRSRPHTHG